MSHYYKRLYIWHIITPPHNSQNNSQNNSPKIKKQL